MPQTPSNQDGKAHALLIGVADYSSYGTDGVSLKGSRNDVVLLAYYCMGVLGIPARNIRVLTTPKMDLNDFKARVIPDEFETNDRVGWLQSLNQVKLGEATEYEVKNGLDWLLAASKESDGAALFAFSGHGAWSSEAGPLLCLGDTAPSFTRGVLSLKSLGESIKNAGVRHKVIALLDCCHVAGSRASSMLQRKALPHAGTPENVVGDQDLFNVSDRVILGAHPGKEAFQMRLGGMWQGALTFAVVTAAERWRADNEMSHGSYKQVLKRAKRTLEVLAIPQKPESWVAIRESPFLGVKPGPTVQEPDAAGSGVQLDPNSHLTGVKGTVYRLTLTVPGTSPLNAPVLSVGTTSPDNAWRAGLEYWALTAAFATLWNSTWPTSSSTPTLDINATPYTTDAPPTDWNNNNNNMTPHASVMAGYWTRSTSPPPTNTLYLGNFGVTVNGSGAVTWYYLGSSAPTQAYVVSSMGGTFTTTQPTATTWWSLST